MDYRKGISPLIAAVLLMAFTIAIGATFSRWAPQLIKSSQQQTSNESEQVQRCASISLKVLEGSGSSVTVQQVGGETAVGNLTSTWFYEDGSIVQGYGEISTPRGAVSISSGSSGSIDRIKVSATSCQGTAPVVYP